jgi:LacI family transcriptional regulator
MDYRMSIGKSWDIMKITAKMLAKELNLSEAAISMALRNKQGVSTETRRKVLEAADKYGYDFSRTVKVQKRFKHLTFVIYKRQGAIVGETPFFSALLDGIESACTEHNYKMHIAYIHRDDDVQDKVDDLNYSDSAGIVLLGTEMLMEDLKPFSSLRKPLVLLDVYFDFIEYDCVLINNTQGAFIATNYLISRTKKQPGYLRSSYPIGNFDERADGFYKSIRLHGLSVSQSIVHKLTPSAEGAFADMMELLERDEKLASCYFADNDLIAIGAMKALQKKGIRIPEDIAIIGFDNLPMTTFISPPLTTIHVPKELIGEIAVKRLIEITNNKKQAPVKIEVSTQLKKRRSV